MIGMELLPIYEEEARKRQQASGGDQRANTKSLRG